MPGYFSYFPKTLYTLSNNGTNVTAVTDILARSAFLKSATENSAVYYEYNIKDGETPEMIASKLYGSATRHWIVLLFNQIMDPYYQWVLSSDQLDSYIENKYGTSINTAKTTIHHYEKVIKKTNIYKGTVLSISTEKLIINGDSVNYETGQITTVNLPSIADTQTGTFYETPVAIDTNYSQQYEYYIKSISNYTYEVELNESRRRIKLLDAAYVARVESEFENLMRS